MAKTSKKILIVEDEIPIVKLLQLKLKKAGFEAEAAYDGEEAIKMIDDHNYDLILLDIMLPKVNGIAVLSHLNVTKNMTPVVVLSNLGQEEDIRKAKDLGVKDYFVKSDITLTDLVKTIQKTIGK